MVCTQERFGLASSNKRCMIGKLLLNLKRSCNVVWDFPVQRKKCCWIPLGMPKPLGAFKVALWIPAKIFAWLDLSEILFSQMSCAGMMHLVVHSFISLPERDISLKLSTQKVISVTANKLLIEISHPSARVSFCLQLHRETRETKDDPLM